MGGKKIDDNGLNNLKNIFKAHSVKAFNQWFREIGISEQVYYDSNTKAYHHVFLDLLKNDLQSPKILDSQKIALNQAVEKYVNQFNSIDKLIDETIDKIVYDNNHTQELNLKINTKEKFYKEQGKRITQASAVAIGAFIATAAILATAITAAVLMPATIPLGLLVIIGVDAAAVAVLALIVGKTSNEQKVTNEDIKKLKQELEDHQTNYHPEFIEKTAEDLFKNLKEGLLQEDIINKIVDVTKKHYIRDLKWGVNTVNENISKVMYAFENLSTLEKGAGVAV